MSKRKSDEIPGATGAKKPKPRGHWNMGLLSSISDPNYFIKADDLVNIIKDKYPKAKFHYLIMPKEHISSLRAVTSKHVSLLKHMEDVALELISDKQHEGHTFKLGYHAQPSMSQLHLHLISDDMNSECLKTKKHWNSFTTDFFMKSEDVRKSLEKNGKVELPPKSVCKQYMETPLKCHKCDHLGTNMPSLKKHILTHLK